MTENTNKTELDNILRRVQKLLAIANDGRGNANEAAAAASQAERIMRKYQIDHADIIEASLHREDSFDQVDVSGTMNPEASAKSTTTWAGMLGLAIGRLHDCKASWARSNGNVVLRYSGYKSDTQVARWTHLYIVGQLRQALKAYQRESGATRAMSEDFRKGFVVAVVANIKEAIKLKQAEMATSATSRDLVVRKADAVAERFGAQKQQTNRYSRGSSFGDGHARGSRVDVGRRGVSGGGGGAILLGR